MTWQHLVQLCHFVGFIETSTEERVMIGCPFAAHFHLPLNKLLKKHQKCDSSGARFDPTNFPRPFDHPLGRCQANLILSSDSFNRAHVFYFMASLINRDSAAILSFRVVLHRSTTSHRGRWGPMACRCGRCSPIPRRPCSSFGTCATRQGTNF